MDLNAIPMAAIKRIEVLRDGAAALYGSDAIAGVINIVLKDNASGGNASIQGGQTYKGDGEQWKLSASSGFAIGNDGALTLSGELHHKTEPIVLAPIRANSIQNYQMAILIQEKRPLTDRVFMLVTQNTKMLRCLRTWTSL